MSMRVVNWGGGVREAGILLHPSSLPSGQLGPPAFRFVDWLARAGVGWWQILPLTPPDAFGSPYASPSAFAMNPALLSDPEAPVSDWETRAFRVRNAVWIEGHMERFGPQSIEIQVRVEREWNAVRAHAATRGVRILGDLPIYVAYGGVEHLARPDLFLPGVVGGVPPDLFTADGQRWGNPVYDWDGVARDGYAWWTARLRRAVAQADLVRLDHFRGFAGFWAIDEASETARDGEWLEGPGRRLFDAARTALGSLPFVAEDLGVITPDVDALREDLGLPGMRVAQFGFDGSPDNPHLLHNIPVASVAYTGTHDNDTLAGWFATLDPNTRGLVERSAGSEGSWGLLAEVLACPATLAILPMQDVLGLGSSARMNTPGSTEGNWSWRLQDDEMDDPLADALGGLLTAVGRRRPPAGG